MYKGELQDLRDELQELTKENQILKDLLTAYLSYEDRQYIRIKYDLDI